MYECSKAVMRRVRDNRFAARYFVGDGIDVGAGEDPLHTYRELFPRMTSCQPWEWSQGDGQLLAGVPDGSLDFVHSSHSLEHLDDPREALANWIRVLKPGGHIIILVPDEDLYEQGIFPSTFNPDHKNTFTIGKKDSWSPRSINVMELLSAFSHRLQVVKIELLDATFLHDVARCDQTMTPIGECAIEIVMRKWTQADLAQKGRLPPKAA
jgi:SAM-dependent methyltransferase